MVVTAGGSVAAAFCAEAPGIGIVVVPVIAAPLLSVAAVDVLLRGCVPGAAVSAAVKYSGVVIASGIGSSGNENSSVVLISVAASASVVTAAGATSLPQEGSSNAANAISSAKYFFMSDHAHTQPKDTQ